MGEINKSGWAPPRPSLNYIPPRPVGGPPRGGLSGFFPRPKVSWRQGASIKINPVVRALNAARLRPQNKGVRICAASGLASQNPRLGLSLAPCFLLLRSGGPALPRRPSLRSSAPRRPFVLVTSSPLPSAPKTGVLKHSKHCFFLSLNSLLAHAVKYSSQLFRPSAFLFSVRGGGSSGPLQPPHRRPLLSSGPKVYRAVAHRQFWDFTRRQEPVKGLRKFKRIFSDERPKGAALDRTPPPSL